MKNYLIKSIRLLINREFDRIYKELIRLRQLLLDIIIVFFLYIKIIIAVNLKKNISLVYDNNDSPPTYGDLMPVLMLVRFLSFFSKKIHFILIQKGRRHDWKYFSEDAALKFEHDQVLLSTLILKRIVNKRITIINSESNLKDNLNIGRYKNIVGFNYRYAPGILQLLAFNKLRKNKFPANFLFTSEEFPPKVDYKYVAWHVRKALWGLERDTGEEDIVKDFFELRKLFPSYRIMLFSTPNGISFARDVLQKNLPKENLLNLEHFLVNQIDPGFIESIPYLVNSQFYFQRIGGGLGEILNYTNVPYVYIDQRGYSFFYSKYKLSPWSKDDQIRTGLDQATKSASLESILRKVNFFESEKIRRMK